MVRGGVLRRHGCVSAFFRLWPIYAPLAHWHPQLPSLIRVIFTRRMELLCMDVFSANWHAGEAAHMAKKHSQLSRLRYLYAGTHCPACLREFHLPYTECCNTSGRLKLAGALWETEDCWMTQRSAWVQRLIGSMRRSTIDCSHGSRLRAHVSGRRPTWRLQPGCRKSGSARPTHLTGPGWDWLDPTHYYRWPCDLMDSILTDIALDWGTARRDPWWRPGIHGTSPSRVLHDSTWTSKCG